MAQDSRPFWYGVALDALLRLPVHRRAFHLAEMARSVQVLDNFTSCPACPEQGECYVWREIAVVGAVPVR